MVRLALSALAIAALPLLAAHAAVTEDDFLIRNTTDLVELCAVAPDDPMRVPALHFCHGFTAGVFKTLAAEQEAWAHKAFCVPTPGPSHNQTLTDFIAWVQADPARGAAPAPDSILRFLHTRFPCGK